MKTIIHRSMLLIAALGITIAMQAAEPVRMKDSVKHSTLMRNLDRALNRHLSFPLNTREDMTGEVFVSFVIDKEGRVEVLDCRSENVQLKDYVLRKLARIDVGENPDGVWRTTHMRIQFRPEGNKT
jgi:hypothetical protein